jgi:DNA segregation ATPase FtsK/SpoIIIE-like protein
MNPLNLQAAKIFCMITGYASTSSLQRHLNLGYNETKQIINTLIAPKFCEEIFTPHYGYKVLKTGIPQ